jgi:hypothetical protein
MSEIQSCDQSKYDVAIITYVVFLWISNSKNIDEVILYQIFDESSSLHFSFFWVHLSLWEVKTLCNQTFWDEQFHFELILSTIFAWKSMMSFSSMLTTMFNSMCAQRRDNILSKDLSTISHVLWWILLFRLTTHQNVRIFRFIQRYSSSINLN